MDKNFGSLKKKALNASSKFRHSFKNKISRKGDSQSNSLCIEDVRDFLIPGGPALMINILARVSAQYHLEIRTWKHYMNDKKILKS